MKAHRLIYAGTFVLGISACQPAVEQEPLLAFSYESSSYRLQCEPVGSGPTDIALPGPGVMMRVGGDWVAFENPSDSDGDRVRAVVISATEYCSIEIHKSDLPPAILERMDSLTSQN
jgi:hypothetical protein